MMIMEYNHCENILVKFIEHGNLVPATWQQFIRGAIKNVFDKTVYGVGYIGEGKYKVSINSKITPQYLIWKSMLMRCYNEKYQEKRPTYKYCEVTEEWHNFQNFATWYDENFYEIDGERMCLDKDILIRGNKRYSPENCVFVPECINNLFLKSEMKRGNLPLGVHFDKRASKYASKCSDGNKKDKHLGFHSTPNEAFQAYKVYKEQLIKQIADEYKNKIPSKLYEAMITYEVEITD
jgi:hypothetical protein